MFDIVVFGLCVSISVYVCFVTIVSPAKMDEPIKMPFGWLAHVGQRKHVLYGGPGFVFLSVLQS